MGHGWSSGGSDDEDTDTWVCDDDRCGPYPDFIDNLTSYDEEDASKWEDWLFIDGMGKRVTPKLILWPDLKWGFFDIEDSEGGDLECDDNARCYCPEHAPFHVNEVKLS
jgi:hypothetical protein